MLEKRAWEDEKTINFTIFNGNPLTFFFLNRRLEVSFCIGPPNVAGPAAVFNT